MMGDLAPSALVKNLLGRLTSEFIQKYGLLWGLKDDILSVNDHFHRIEAVLDDAEEKRSKDKDSVSWLKRIRCATMMTEDVLDDISTQAMLQHLHKEKGIKYTVRAFFSSDQNQFMFRVRIANKVKAVRSELDSIVCKVPEKSSVSTRVGMDVAGEMPTRERRAVIRDSLLIFGRNKETEMITEKICNKSIGKQDNGEIRVYSIYGQGGIGKTTLARLVYNHERVNKYFELKCWIHVSDNFQVEEIIKQIIELVDKRECTLTHLDVLQESLQTKLRGKKFLIVLDDVWIEEFEKAKWRLLSETLSFGAEESIVMTTTRSQISSQIMSKVPELQYELKVLLEEDSWLLFKKLAFAGREGDEVSELECIGRDIVSLCKGLPLAVMSVGSYLWSKKNESDWLSVKEHMMEESQGNTEFHALKTIFDNLHPYVKQCLAYCCLFPAGYPMEKDVVIQLWVLNGLIPPGEEIGLYGFGEEFFYYLVWRSFFQVVTDKKYSNDRYRMHDLIHGIARDMMRDECLIIKDTSNEVVIPNETLHLSSSCPDFKFSPQDLGKLTSLRSIFMFGKAYECSISQISNHMYLRVLYLCGIGLRTLPKSICKLKHLKYLNLSYSSIEVLPESIIYLQNLQVLLLNFCYQLCSLPQNLRYMRGLRHLDISSCHSLLQMPFGFKELASLRGLPRFHVGANMKNGAKIGELGYLDHLEGVLEISGLENVRDLDEAKSAKLKAKRNLSILKLSWSNIYMRESMMKRFSTDMFGYDEKVLEGLEPNSSLKELKISFYMGKILSPYWMLNLENLVEIGFFGCKRCERIPKLGSLSNLRVIKLLGMDSLECFDQDDMSGQTDMFLGLEELHAFMCPRLVSLPSNLPKLKVLKLEECEDLILLPDEFQSFKDLEELEISGCRHLSKRFKKDTGVYWPLISHIPHIRIDFQDITEEEDEIDE